MRGERVGVEQWKCEVPWGGQTGTPLPCGQSFFYEAELIAHLEKDHQLTRKDLDFWSHEVFRKAKDEAANG